MGYHLVSFAESLERYRREVSPKCYLHSVNLNSSDATSVAPSAESLNNLMSGFTSTIFEMMMRFEGQVVEEEPQEEGVVKKDAKVISIPTLDYIRENY
jgi:hypothetical protein